MLAQGSKSPSALEPATLQCKPGFGWACGSMMQLLFWRYGYLPRADSANREFQSMSELKGPQIYASEARDIGGERISRSWINHLPPRKCLNPSGCNFYFLLVLHWIPAKRFWHPSKYLNTWIQYPSWIQSTICNDYHVSQEKIYPMSSRPFNVFVCPLGPLRGAFDRPPQTLRHIGKPPANANLCSGISTREKHIESTMAKLLCPSLCRPSAISHHVFIKHKASTTAKTQTWTRWGNTNRCSVVPLEQFYIVVPLHPLLPCLSSKSSNKSMEVLRYFSIFFVEVCWCNTMTPLLLMWYEIPSTSCRNCHNPWLSFNDHPPGELRWGHTAAMENGLRLPLGPPAGLEKRSMVHRWLAWSIDSPYVFPIFFVPKPEILLVGHGVRTNHVGKEHLIISLMLTQAQKLGVWVHRQNVRSSIVYPQLLGQAQVESKQ